jgi:hypothetical protein
MVDLITSDGWDSINNQIRIDTEMYDVDSHTWVRVSKAPRKSEPSVQEAHQVFSKLLAVSQDKELGIIRLTLLSNG